MRIFNKKNKTITISKPTPIDKIKKLFEKYDLISIGHNCFPKKYIKNKIKDTEYLFFDYIGTPMWSVCELFQNDFTNLFDYGDYNKLQIYDNQMQMTMTNSKYYIRFTHDLDTNNFNEYLFNEFVKKYMERIKRLYDILNNKINVVFIRYKEIHTNRIMHEKYHIKYSKTEYEYLIDFSNTIKQKFPNLKFKILFISSDDNDFYDSTNNILIIKTIENKIIDWNNTDTEFSELFIQKYDIIYQTLNQ